MKVEKINAILKARCDECGSENATITGTTCIGVRKESSQAESETYYYQCNDCGNVFYIIKEPS